MSRENVDLVLTGYEAWDRGDIETAFAPIDEDFEFHEDPQYPEQGVIEGGMPPAVTSRGSERNGTTTA